MENLHSRGHLVYTLKLYWGTLSQKSCQGSGEAAITNTT